MWFDGTKKFFNNIRIAFLLGLIFLSLGTFCVLFISINVKKKNIDQSLEQVEKIKSIYKAKLDKAILGLEKIKSSEFVKKVYANEPISKRDLALIKLLADSYEYGEIFFTGANSELVLSLYHTPKTAQIVDELAQIQKEKVQPKVPFIHNFSHAFLKGYHIVVRDDIFINGAKKGEIWVLVPIENFPVLKLAYESFLIINKDIIIGDARTTPSKADVEKLLSAVQTKNTEKYRTKGRSSYIVRQIYPYGWAVAMKIDDGNIVKALHFLFFFFSLLTIWFAFVFQKVEKDYSTLMRFEKWVKGVRTKLGSETPIEIDTIPTDDKISSAFKELIQEIQAKLIAQFERNYDDFVDKTRDIAQRITTIKSNIELVMNAILEPTTNSASIASGIGELTGSSKELITSAKLAADVTKDSEKILMNQNKTWKNSTPLIGLLIEKNKELRNALGKLSQLIISATGILKSLEDKLWMLFAHEQKYPSNVTPDNISYQGVFRSIGDLITFLDAIETEIAKLKSDSELIDSELLKLDDEVKEALYYAENFLSIQKRLLGILERLIMIADGNTWSLDDIQHTVQNIATATWDIATHLRNILKELEKIALELDEYQLSIGKESFRKAA